MSTENKNKRSWWKRLRDKYRLIVLDETTLETKSSFLLSRLNVFAAISSILVLLSLVILALLFFTPLKQYLPANNQAGDRANLYKLNAKTDSLEQVAAARAVYLRNIKNIFEGNIDSLSTEVNIDQIELDSNIVLTPSHEDSLFRLQMDSLERGYILNQTTDNNNRFSQINFYSPLKGFISSKFNPEEEHYGIDIVAPENEPIKAIQEGRVILADWTVDAGYVIMLQHENDLISVYKHNSVLLKKVGNFVKAGDVVAIIGNSGELTSGSHLHLELWNNGIALDPQKFIHF